MNGKGMGTGRILFDAVHTQAGGRFHFFSAHDGGKADEVAHRSPMRKKVQKIVDNPASILK